MKSSPNTAARVAIFALFWLCGYGTLSLSQLNLTVQTLSARVTLTRDGSPLPAQVTLARNGSPLPCHFTTNDEGQLLVQFDQLELKPGESLTATLNF